MKKILKAFWGPVLFGFVVATMGIGRCAPEKRATPEKRTMPGKRTMIGAEEEGAEKIKALPYLSGYRPAPEKVGVTRHRGRSTRAGLNFYISGHAPRAYLTDMEGNVLHQWGIAYKDVWSRKDNRTYHFRRAHLFDNGDILVIFGGGAQGMVKLDKDSRVLWAYRGDYENGGCHHDFFVAGDGKIYALTNSRVLDREYKGRKFAGPFMEGFITILSPEGDEIRRIPLIDCFQNSDYVSILGKMRRAGDIFHTNTIEILDGKVADRVPFAREGRALISSPYLSAVAVIDLETEKVVWARDHGWKEQHEPTLLESGNMILFDNKGGAEKKSRVLEFSPITGEDVWTYGDEPPESLHSDTCGTVQRLPNGNTLITETALK